jgi:uncharacterized protein (TIGR04255 family)
MQRLPVEITPNPLVNSSVELRFSSNFDSSHIISKVLPLFSPEFPVFKPGVPKEIKAQNELFKYSGDIILQNASYALSFSENAIGFDCIAQYPLWKSYSAIIQSCLTKYFNLQIINKIERIGVRYGSIFEGTTKIEDVARFKPSVPIEGFEQNFQLIRLDLKKEPVNIHLQLANNAKAVRQDTTQLSGVYIDIDSSITESFEANEKIFKIIDELHDSGKALFFDKILKAEFLESLNPTY